MLTIGIMGEVGAWLLSMMHFASYGSDGIGVLSLYITGSIFDLVGDLVIILLAILIAQGYARNSMSLTQTKLTFSFLGVVLVIYVAMDIWSSTSIGGPKVQFLYDTAPGVIVLVLRLLLFAYFAYSIYISVKAEKRKQKVDFFVVFGIAFAVWFLYLPIFVLIALAAPNYHRELFVTAISMVVDFVAWSSLTVLLSPKYIYKFFVVKDPQAVVLVNSQLGNDDL